MEWKAIPGYPGYEVSNTGDVRRGDRVLKGTVLTQPSGYKQVLVDLCKYGTKTKCTVSRLVAKAFIPNPDNLPTVDHIDRVSTNNHVSNLRWASYHMQNMNQYQPIGASGHRHIYKIGNGWQVRIWRHNQNVFYKCCQTIEEAIKARDAWLMTVGPEFH
jgi:hypothetical protein